MELATATHVDPVFSANHPRRSVRPTRGSHEQPTPDFLRIPVAAAPRWTRRNWLNWLAGHNDIFAGIDTPGVFPIPRYDPYRSPEVLAVAARITRRAWRHSGMTRGFARNIGAGIVPERIRMNPTRFVQSSDSWYAMFHDRALYERAVDLLRATPELADVVDFDAVATTVRSWPWGHARPAPPLGQTAMINRILALAQFIHDARERLAELSVTD